ncbi:hypothetical protein MRS44_006897 [Fusarium solani]|uniref:uncharacterized protein n=1 Tax=Fusarium solani TaxID=169388 RepID=UPI0032C4A498|nr:hypothetical protein MRS44_006897 [Fusarium solani]
MIDKDRDAKGKGTCSDGWQLKGRGEDASATAEIHCGIDSLRLLVAHTWQVGSANKGYGVLVRDIPLATPKAARLGSARLGFQR